MITEPKSLDRALIDVINDVNSGQYIIQPAFQRNYVWTVEKQIKLIESVFLGFPIPQIFVVNTKNNKTEVIDGQQRLGAFCNFMNGELSLKNKNLIKLKNNVNYSDKTWKQLTKKQQIQFNNYSISIILINETDEDEKFELFARINMGATTLKEQEIRNCIYHGSFSNLLKQIGENVIFRKIIEYGNSKASLNRMRDRQFVLEFLSFHENIQNYNSSKKKHLNDFMRENKNTSYEKLENWRILFYKTLTKTVAILGDSPFKKINRKGNIQKFNIFIYNVVMNSFEKIPKPQLMSVKDSIQESIYNLMMKDVDFIKISNKGGCSGHKLRAAIRLLDLEISKILKNKGNLITGERFYNHNLKDVLAKKQNNLCSLCNNSFENDINYYTEIDHKEPYWRVGQSLLENAQLTHRFCNRSKSGKSLKL